MSRFHAQVQVHGSISRENNFMRKLLSKRLKTVFLFIKRTPKAYKVRISNLLGNVKTKEQCYPHFYPISWTYTFLYSQIKSSAKVKQKAQLKPKVACFSG